MKIGIDARFYGPGSKGLGRYTQKLITYLEHIDTENEYVIFLREENFSDYEPKNKNFTKVLADYRWYTIAEQLIFPYILYKHKCDIVHFPHFNVPVFYFRKFVVTIHDLILLRYPTRKASTHGVFLYWFKFLMYRAVIFNAVKSAKSIIAVSRFTKKDICVQYKVDCEKIIVTHEAAEVIEVKKENDVDDILEKYGIIKPYVLYVGNAYPHKNLHFLVDVFEIYAKNNDSKMKKLVLVGCDDYFYRNLREYIKTKKISNDIIILENVSDFLLRTLYKQAHLFVFPSLYEGFGLPPLEAQLLGIPVLSSDHECMTEVLSESGALYCDAKDIEKFAQAMKKIAEDDELRGSLITNGQVNAKKYSWKKMAQQTLNIYKRK